jgi:lipopolysaccharide transport system ATP-binding protein
MVRGRVAALLELGAGFNLEFTGRENVYLNASVLGLSRSEIDQRYDAICAFADIGQFVDQPVKTYSSGMTVRLAFAVAINVDPEILIVDEALAVGDERFQRKCYSRIEEIKSRGATVLFVSHSGSTVIDLCDRAILLDDGAQLATGAPKSIIGRYQRLLYAAPEQRELIRAGILAEAPALLAQTELPLAPAQIEPSAPHKEQGIEVEGTACAHDTIAESYDPALTPSSTVAHESQGAEVRGVFLANDAGKPVNNILRGRSYQLHYSVDFEKAARTVRFGMLITSSAGVLLGGSISASNAARAIPFVPAGTTYSVSFRFTCRLNPGVYFFNSGVLGIGSDGTETYLHRLVDAAMFRVLPQPDDTATGIVDFDCVGRFTPLTE